MKSYKTEMMPIGKIQEYENNPRLNDETVHQVARSIQDVGWTSPIVVDENHIILAGHTRLKAAKHLQLESVPVYVALSPEGKPLAEETKKAYRILDNKATELSQWDDQKLSEEFEHLALADFDLALTGFSVSEIEKITESLMEFEDPLAGSSEEIFEPLDLPQSQIKMVQLFLTAETEPEFREACELIQVQFSCETLTDAVVKAVEQTAGIILSGNANPATEKS